MTLTEEQIAHLTSDMARRIESHDLFDVPDGAKYHTAANTIATDLVRCVVGPALEAANKRAAEAEQKLQHSDIGVKNLIARAESAEAELAKVTDPNAVHVNMLRGTIAKPSVAQIKHLYGDAVADTADLTRAAEQAVTDEMVERAAAALRPDLFVPLSADELRSNDFALTERENATANTRRKARAALISALKVANKRAEEAEARRKCYECGSEMTACARCNPELPTAERDTLKARADEAEALVETLKREAQLHAQEARTANATIAEIYREVSGGKGEPGNWNGAKPVREELTTLRARVAELEAALKNIDRMTYKSDGDRREMIRARVHAALKGASHEQG